MRKCFLALFLAVPIFAHGAASPAATQAWVKNYIAGLDGATTNGEIRVDIGGTNGVLTATIEYFEVSALMVTNSLVAFPTNGTYLAYTSGGAYSNTVAGVTVQATQTNLVYDGVGSYLAPTGFDTFTNLFSVVGCFITPSMAREVLQ